MQLQIETTLTTAIETISPDLAAQYLKTQQKNRKLNGERIEVFANDIRSNRWLLTGEAIKFDVYGHLIDGQHRLSAIIRSNTSATMLVIRGCEEEVQSVLDSGQSRTVAQAFDMHGIAATVQEVAVLRGMFSTVGNFEPRNISRQRLFEAWDVFHQSVRFASKKNGVRAMPGSTTRAVVARAHFCGEDAERLERFLYVADTGFSESSTDNPAIAMRLVYLNSKRNTSSRGVIYSKSLSAVRSFLSYSTVRQIRASREQLWTIPEIDN